MKEVEEMRTEIINKEVKESILISIVLIILGIILFLKNIEFVDNVMNFFGLISILSSLLFFLLYFRLDKQKQSFSNDFLKATSLLFLGVIFILKAEFFISMIPILIGCFFTLKNLSRWQLLINLKKQDKQIKTSFYILTGICIILTIGIIYVPFDFHLSISKYIAIIILTTELINIYQSFGLLKLVSVTGNELK